MFLTLKTFVPRPVRRPVRWAWDFARGKAVHSWAGRGLRYDIQDAWDWVRGRGDPLHPPRRLIFQVGGDLANGERFLAHFRDLGRLQPQDHVLDVGCGVGRMALPLTRYLDPAGRYEGFDIMPAHVRWCRRAVSSRFPNFRFQHANVFNREYNPRGGIRGADYRFPYADGSFDFAFLTSVFTHLLPDEMTHYLAELGRVLRPGGRCLATAYLLNDEANDLLAAGRGKFSLEPGDGRFRVVNPHVPEACVAFDEGYFFAAARRAGLNSHAVHYGLWCGRESWLDYQDIAILQKETA